MSKDNLDIEKIFKEAFDNYEVDPGSNAWKAIQSKIGANAASTASGSVATSVGGSWISTSLIAISIAAIGVGGYFYLTNPPQENQQKEETLIEEKVKVPQENIEENTISLEENIISNVAEDVEKETIEKKESTLKTSSSQTEGTGTTHSTNNDKKLAKEGTIEKKEEQAESKVIKNVIEDVSVENSSTEEKSEMNAKASDVSSESHARENKENNFHNEGANNESKGVNEHSGSSTTNTRDTIAIEEPFSYIPNIFSPNGDGTNDVWEITVESYDAIDILVFDVNNNVIFKAKDLDNPWNGKLRDGRAANEGVYFYKIVIESQGRIYRKAGSISLKR